MTALDCVQRCWRHLLARRGCDAQAAAVALDEIVQAHGAPHRHYHTLDHVHALLVLLDHHSGAATDRDAVTLAILFHDIVYDPLRQDNEQASAALAAKCLTGLGFGRETVAKVARYILATRHDAAVDAAGEPDLALLLDLDLSILAAAPEAYRAYAQAVRREYAIVPGHLYRPGRRRILEGFLARERIYLTPQPGANWERPARANLAAEIAELS